LIIGKLKTLVQQLWFKLLTNDLSRWLMEIGQKIIGFHIFKQQEKFSTSL